MNHPKQRPDPMAAVRAQEVLDATGQGLGHPFTPGPHAGERMRTMSHEATVRKLRRAGVEPVTLSDAEAMVRADDMINDLNGRPRGTLIDLEELGEQVSEMTGINKEPTVA